MSRRFVVNSGVEQNSLNPVNTSRNMEPEHGDPSQGISDEQFRDQLYRVLAVNRNILPQLLARSMIDNVNAEVVMTHLGLDDIFKRIESNIQRRFDQMIEMIADNYQRTVSMVQNSINLRQPSVETEIKVGTATVEQDVQPERTASIASDEQVSRQESSMSETDNIIVIPTGENEPNLSNNVDDVQEESPNGSENVEQNEDFTTAPNFDPTTDQSTITSKPPHDSPLYPSTLT